MTNLFLFMIFMRKTDEDKIRAMMILQEADECDASWLVLSSADAAAVWR